MLSSSSRSLSAGLSLILISLLLLLALSAAFEFDLADASDSAKAMQRFAAPSSGAGSFVDTSDKLMGAEDNAGFVGGMAGGSAHRRRLIQPPPLKRAVAALPEEWQDGQGQRWPAGWARMLVIGRRSARR